MAPVIRVLDVSKRFQLHHDKSLKERLLNTVRRKSTRDEFWALRRVGFELEQSKTVCPVISRT